MSSPRVALVTAAAFPDLAEGEARVIPELAALGITAVPAVWDDPSVQWDDFALSVVRCTWDYHDRRDDFVRWAQTVPRLCNPADVLEWNTDKRYLRQLGAAGIPIVPTAWIEPGGPHPELPTGEVVIKPAISAGARNTARHADAFSPDARVHIQRLLDARQVVMVQPHIASVAEHGEVAVIHLDGSYSHAVRKGPILTAAAETLTAVQPTDAQRRVAEQVLSALSDDLLYSRVDLVEDDGGEQLVLEVELTEPSLFLDTVPEAAATLARAIARRVDR